MPGVEPAHQVDVDPSGEREQGGFLRVRRHAVVHQLQDRGVVGNDHAVEAPAVAQQLAQQLALRGARSEEHTSELQSLMRISYAVFCLKRKTRSKQPETQV